MGWIIKHKTTWNLSSRHIQKQDKTWTYLSYFYSFWEKQESQPWCKGMQRYKGHWTPLSSLMVLTCPDDYMTNNPTV
jgi:hypothetical protein